MLATADGMDASMVCTKPADRDTRDGTAGLVGSIGRAMPWKRQNRARSLEEMAIMGRTHAGCPGPSLQAIAMPGICRELVNGEAVSSLRTCRQAQGGRQLEPRLVP